MSDKPFTDPQDFTPEMLAMWKSKYNYWRANRSMAFAIGCRQLDGRVSLLTGLERLTKLKGSEFDEHEDIATWAERCLGQLNFVRDRAAAEEQIPNVMAPTPTAPPEHDKTFCGLVARTVMGWEHQQSIGGAWAWYDMRPALERLEELKRTSPPGTLVQVEYYDDEGGIVGRQPVIGIFAPDVDAGHDYMVLAKMRHSLQFPKYVNVLLRNWLRESPGGELFQFGNYKPGDYSRAALETVSD